MSEPTDSSAVEAVGRKRRRQLNREESYKNTYEGFHFEAIAASGRPRSPHQYFNESYCVKIPTNNIDDQKTELLSPIEVQPVIHRHANGLCIVTAGLSKDLIPFVESVSLCVTPAPAANQNEKKKKANKMLKGKGVSCTVRPNDVLAKIYLTNCQVCHVLCGVFGTVLEVNEKLSAETLTNDPLLDGYLAIIQPAGPFPPNSVAGNHKDDEKSA